jgi:hypothetical protein
MWSDWKNTSVNNEGPNKSAYDVPRYEARPISIQLEQWFPKCGARLPGGGGGGGASGVWRKRIERNLHLAIFSELYLPYIYHPVLITNFITL